ncbi:hypothetical protein VTK73DRAFT_139 [Phialemonium thermophilum]|uniref:RRM domain-containing protein n=1 Tax=Phialemonium thermophilum TaxID=223376 RepID=A0ABR3XGJ5_9PEZI
MERPTDVPGLENRRESYSTTESTPATPYFGSVSDRGNTARIAVVRSAYNTPSPDQGQGPNGLEGAGARKSPAMSDIKLGQLLEQEPKIPQAIPAVFTLPYHVKSLHQCLENRIVGNRNVYIRGLHPTTDDELLLKYAERFGPVEQSKAIIDTTTGACKGFGFAKFVDVRDSEKCIRGFYRLGYEESFNARLKAEGDDNSTNLYLSNLPKRLTETELNAIFDGYTVVSSKILRDSMGNSRGVGFARFATRDECEDVIKKFHGAPIGEEGMIMQVRYADTPAQKELKRITAERRQFRTNEYNIGAYGTAEVGIHPSIYTHASWNRRAVNGGSGKTQSEPSCNGMQGGKRESTSLSGGTITAGTASASDDEGATIVDSPTVVCGTTQSSPIVKTEHA